MAGRRISYNDVKPFLVENARIGFLNFAGAPDKYNRNGGVRQFTLFLDDLDYANKLVDEGWNVRIKMPDEEGGTPRMSLPIKVSFVSIPNIPKTRVYLYTKKSKRSLDEDTIGELDGIDIESVDLVVRPRIWYDEDTDDDRIKAYLEEMHVKARESMLEDKWAERECPEEEVPFA